MPLLFTPLSLFGGAIKISLPSQFRDVSDYFPIEDNQEIFQDKDHPEVVFTVELLEHESSVPNSAAGKFFLEDAVKTEKNCIAGLEKVWEMDVVKEMPELGCAGHPPSSLYMSEKDVGTPKQCTYACQVLGKKLSTAALHASSEKVDKSDSAVHLVVLRFPDEITTDIVISLFVPVESQKSSFTFDEVDVVWRNALESFRILQWNLFG